MPEAGPGGESAAVRGVLQRLLICKVGALSCALPLESVSETMRQLPTKPVAGMPPFIAGLAIVRGAAVPVVSLAELLGGGASGERQQFVVVQLGQRRLALLVDRVLGVRTLEVGKVLGALPPLLLNAKIEFIRAIGATDNQLMILLEQSRILPESIWVELQIEGS